MSDFWRQRACLVTGGAGFGGSHLCELLLELGARVYVLDRWLPATSYLVLSGNAERVDYIQGDIRDRDLLAMTIERFQIRSLFHLAAQPIVPTSNLLPFETLSVNAMGTFCVLETVRGSSCVEELIVASSGAYYGTTSASEPLTEDDPPLVATNIYATSKVAADHAVRCYAAVYGLRTAVCRFMNTYGPGDTNFSRLVPRAIRNLLDGEPYEFGDRDDGSSRLDFLHIRDMCRAYIEVTEQLDKVRGEAINFASGMPTSTRELADMISRLFDDVEREPAFNGPSRQRPLSKQLAIRKAKARLNWQPQTSLEDGLRETIEWYRRFMDVL